MHINQENLLTCYKSKSHQMRPPRLEKSPPLKHQHGRARAPQTSREYSIMRIAGGGKAVYVAKVLI